MFLSELAGARLTPVSSRKPMFLAIYPLALHQSKDKLVGYFD
jgi:hypothetical protein